MAAFRKKCVLGFFVSILILFWIHQYRMLSVSPLGTHKLTPSNDTSVVSIATPKELKPQKNIYFIKIHRTGSGSFHNVLVRFAIKHNATVALNTFPDHDMFPRTVSRDALHPSPYEPNFTGYNMWVDHALFNKAASDALLPKDTVYITQIREPFSHAPSIFKHLTMWDKNLVKVKYTDLLKHPEKFEKYAIRTVRGLEYSVSRNMLATEMGYSKPLLNDTPDFMGYLETLNKQLLHVSIVEELPESLVLLKRKLNWELQDIFNVPIHVHVKQKLQPDQVLLEKHRKRSSLDYALYDYFLSRHKREVAQQGPSFQEEVKTLLEIQETYAEFCNGKSACAAFKDVSPSDIGHMKKLMGGYHTVPASKFNKAFNITYTDCVTLRLDEMPLKRILKTGMYPGLCLRDSNLAKKLKLKCNNSMKNILPGLEYADIEHALFPGKCKKWHQ